MLFVLWLNSLTPASLPEVQAGASGVPLWTFSIFDKSTVTTSTTNSFGILPF